MFQCFIQNQYVHKLFVILQYKKARRIKKLEQDN